MTAPTYKAGQYPQGADVEWTVDSINNLKAAGWTDYSAPSMTITGSTTSPTLGNSTLQAFYRQAVGTDVIDFVFKLTIGSTFSAGSGLYTFSMPIAMLAPQLNIGVCNWLETGVAYYSVALLPISANELIMARDGATGALTHTGPSGAGWTAGDILSGQIRYAVST